MRVCVPTPGRMKRAADSLAGSSSSSPATRDPAADDDELGVEDVDDVGDAHPEAFPEDAHAFTRIGIAVARGRDDRGAVAQAARLAEAVQRAAGGQVLQRGVVGLARGARRRAVGEVGADDDVAELGRGARAPR